MRLSLHVGFSSHMQQEFHILAKWKSILAMHAKLIAQCMVWVDQSS